MHFSGKKKGDIPTQHIQPIQHQLQQMVVNIIFKAYTSTLIKVGTYVFTQLKLSEIAIRISL